MWYNPQISLVMERHMPLPKALTAYEDVSQILDKALAMPDGAKIQCLSPKKAIHLRHRMNYYRALMRKLYSEVFPDPTDPKHGTSPFDHLVFRVEDDRLIIEHRGAESFVVEPLTKEPAPKRKDYERIERDKYAVWSYTHREGDLIERRWVWEGHDYKTNLKHMASRNSGFSTQQEAEAAAIHATTPEPQSLELPPPPPDPRNPPRPTVDDLQLLDVLGEEPKPDSTG